jgi:hypothetical protein
MIDIWGGPSGANRLCQREERGRHSFEPHNYSWKLPPLTAVPPLIRADDDPTPARMALKAYAVQGCTSCGLVRLLDYPNGRPFWYGWQGDMEAAIAAWQRDRAEQQA